MKDKNITDTNKSEFINRYEVLMNVNIILYLEFIYGGKSWDGKSKTRDAMKCLY